MGRRMTRLAVAAAVIAAATVPTPASGGAVPGTDSGQGEVRNIRVVGHSDLGGQGLNGEVAVVANTAIVAAGFVPMNTMQGANTLVAATNNAPPCATVPVKVVDLSRPSNPTVTATIPVPAGQAARDVDLLRVNTPKFKGLLGAVAFASCDYDQQTFRERGVVQPGSFAHRGVAYYDVTNARSPRFLGRYLADFENFDPAAPPCGRPPEGGEARCAQDQFSVELKRIRDGRILSLSTRPDGATRATPATDARLVDVTDPTDPVQLGVWPALGEPPSRSSNNGCYPRSGTRSARFSPDGTKLYVPYLDGGLFVVDILDLANPKAVGQWTYPADWDVEGQAAYVAPAEINGRQLALVADEDIWWQTSAFRVDAPARISGDKIGCSDLFTSADTKFVSQIFRHENGEIPGELAYVGRGCPSRKPAATVIPEDPYLADPRGKLVFADSAKNPVTQPGIAPAGCTFNSRVRRAQDAGALGVVLVTSAQSESIAGFPPTGSPREPTDQNGALTGDVSIPGFQVKRPAGDAIRSVLCPTLDSNGKCTGGESVTGALVDYPGEWGGLRVIDVTNPAAPSQSAVYRTAASRQMPPPDYRGIYSVHHAVVEGDRSYVAWNSDGLRVLDIGSGVPSEIASFVPPDAPDPTGTVPDKTRVIGVDYNATHIVISDINSGLWVLEKPAPFGGRGTWMAAADGTVYPLGDAPALGSVAAPGAPIVGLTPTSTGKGYWVVSADGTVYAFGDAPAKGGTGGKRIGAPIVGMAATPSDQGYWLVGADGGVFAFGDALFYGSTGGIKLNRPVVAMTASPTGGGYWLTASDGGIFSFGDADFVGSTGGIRLNEPVVGMAAAPEGDGYLLVARDGGVFTFGNAVFQGSAGGIELNQPVVGITARRSGSGYWLVAADGGTFSFNVPFVGSLAGSELPSEIVAMAALPR